MHILITGARGKLGSRLVEQLQDHHHITALGRDDLDITNFQFVQAAVQQAQPDLIINAAAWTDVDGCAKNPEHANLVNSIGAQNLSVAAYHIKATIVQLSSNEVFDGRAKHPYHEYDDTGAVNPYGYSKLLGERAVIQSNPRHYVIRFSWLFAHGGRNFIHAILDAARAGKTLRVVIDEVANPTYDVDLVGAIKTLIISGRYGIYHLTNTGTTSRYHFARYILDQAGLDDVDIQAISRHEWQRASTPPYYTALANTQAQHLGIVMPSWEDAVKRFLMTENLILA